MGKETTGYNYLNGKKLPRKLWTEKEDEIIIKHYRDYTGKELHEKFFPERTIRAVECRAAKLGANGKTEEAKIRSRNYQNDEWKDKISNSKKEYFKTHDNWWKGKKRSPENCKKISNIRKKAGYWKGNDNPRHKNPLNGEKNGRWKGGILATYLELRSETKDWMNSSMEFCNYRCVITNDKFDNVHHTTAFRDIVDEVFNMMGIELKAQVCDYSDDEFKSIRSNVKLAHASYGYGACLNKNVHKLFHDLYGYTKISPYDFLDFIYRIDVGEFDNWFKNNNLDININYDYVKYLEETLFKIKCA